PKVVARIYQTLAALKGKMSLLVVEQNLSQGLSLADRLLFLDSGRLVREFSGGDVSLKQVEELYLGAQ
ncbi:MAG: ABC transporter ATP-binding protein, partial [Thermodesulfobacteria bacterium]|nr:ABC transporter ATP-binding protein [Thermodesulfobacteriota bacterium]